MTISNETERAYPIYEDKGSHTAMLKDGFRTLHQHILDTVPAGRAREIALTHLETASMFAVKQIHQGIDGNG